MCASGAWLSSAPVPVPARPAQRAEEAVAFNSLNWAPEPASAPSARRDELTSTRDRCSSLVGLPSNSHVTSVWKHIKSV